MTTDNLGLILTPSEEWGTKKFREFLTELAESGDDSALIKIDTAVGSLQTSMSAIETTLSSI